VNAARAVSIVKADVLLPVTADEDAFGHRLWSILGFPRRAVTPLGHDSRRRQSAGKLIVSAKRGPRLWPIRWTGGEKAEAAMSSPSVTNESDPSKNHHLTIGYLLRFSWPLAATFLMMAAAAPMIAHGITIIKDSAGERIHLSAFLLVAVASISIYSPTFVSRDVANRVVTDRASLLRITWFFLFWSAIMSVILAALALEPNLRHLVFVRILNGSEDTEQLAIAGMLVFAGVPFLAAMRGIGQGCHISNGETWYVGMGTALRLVAIAVFVYGFAIRHDLSGPVLGALTYLIGMGVETVYVLLMLRNKPQWTVPRRGPALTFGQFTRYAGPLMAGSLLLQLAPNILVIIIGRAAMAEENKAAYSVTRDCCWFFMSVLWVIPSLIVTHAKSIRNLRMLLALCIGATIVLTVMTGVLAVPAVRDLVFVTVFKVNNRAILSLISLGLLWFLPTPAMILVNHLVTALHTRSGRTMWVTAGNLAGLGLLTAVALWPNLESFNGIVLAVAGNSAYLLVSTLVQVIGLFNGGFQAALDPRSLAERMRKTSPDATPAVTDAAFGSGAEVAAQTDSERAS